MIMRDAWVTRIIVVGLFVVSLVLGGAVHVRQSSAQALDLGQRLSVRATPPFPAPFEQVNIRVQSFDVDVRSLPIEWYVNGELIQRGTGLTDVLVQMGDADTRLQIDVSVQLPSGETITQQTVLEATLLHLLWEAQESYVPPFYRGKALPSSEGLTKVVAIPEQIERGDQMTYTWRNRGNVDQSQSGYARQDFLVRNRLFEESSIIEVDASISTGSTMRGLVEIPRFSPDPLLLLDTGTLTRVVLGGRVPAVDMGSYELVVEPYFFSTDDSGDVIVNWTVNGSRQSVSGPGQVSLPIRVESGQAGLSTFSAEVLHSERALQDAVVSGDILLQAR